MSQEQDEDSPPVPTHPEEMTAAVDLRIGSQVTLRARARATPAGIIAVALLLAAIMVPLAIGRRQRGSARPG